MAYGVRRCIECRAEYLQNHQMARHRHLDHERPYRTISYVTDYPDTQTTPGRPGGFVLGPDEGEGYWWWGL